jgi:tRNA U34 5-methylaminomethyl-2-thiouridine-forming methyltransferase MnmC
MNNSFQTVMTGDGSYTLYIPDLNEYYHSKFGAVNESLHIFINAGIKNCKGTGDISVYEAGFGTGLNALLTLQFANDSGRKVIYHAIEKYPLSEDVAVGLNYATSLPFDGYFRHMHSSPWNEYTAIAGNFILHKIQADLAAYMPDFSYDIIYFDAFAPEKQPYLWEYEIFERLAGRLNEGGMLVTYCVKGDVKRALRKTGLNVEILPGPPGKRHMLRAVKPYSSPF